MSLINNKLGIGFTNGVVILGVVVFWADEFIIKYTTPASTIKIIIINIYIINKDINNNK